MGNVPKKILMLIPSFGFGGAQKVFFNLGLELGKRFEIIECGFENDSNIAYPSNNQVLYLNVSGSQTYLGKFTNFFKRVSSLSKIKKSISPDFTISHLEGADYVNVLAKGPGKNILCIHGTKNYDKKIRGGLGFIRKKILIPRLYRKADYIITVSSEIKDELANHYGINKNKISVIYNWFDANRIEIKASEFIDDRYKNLFNKKTVILSGRFDIQKNFILFLEVIKKTVAIDSSVRFLILGDGDLREEMIKKTKELSINFNSPWESTADLDNASLVYLGYQDNPYKFLKNSNLFIMPSNWEGFPLALGEAMACGLPVASANCPTGPAEMLGFNEGSSKILFTPEYTEHGILLPLLNKDERKQNIWAEYIINQLKDQESLVMYSEKSKNRIKAYSKEKIIKEWESLLNQQL